MIRFFCFWALICPLPSISQTPPSRDVTGIIVTTNQSPIPGVNLALLQSKRRATTGENGRFYIETTRLPDTLLITHIGYKTRLIALTDKTRPDLQIILEPTGTDLGEVIVNTGYQSLPKERATGSFVQMDKELINRKVSTNILDRLDGVTGGLLFNRNKAAGANEASIQIRGRSTLFGQVDPLIVVDNFPYDGDMNNINPNEVESITILKIGRAHV